MGYIEGTDGPTVTRPKPAPRIVTAPKVDPMYGAPIASTPAPQYGASIGAAPVARAVATPRANISPVYGASIGAAPVSPVSGGKLVTVPGSPGPTVPGGVNLGPGVVTPAAAAEKAAADKAAQDEADQKEIDDAHDAEVVKAEAHLQTQLDAIAAQFNMTKEQLEADRGEAGRQYRAAKMGLMLQRDAAIEQNMNSMVERGIIKSGLTVSNQNVIERDTAIGVSGALGERDYAQAQIAAQQASLPAQQAAENAVATAQHEAALRDLETMKALAEGGLG